MRHRIPPKTLFCAFSNSLSEGRAESGAHPPPPDPSRKTHGFRTDPPDLARDSNSAFWPCEGSRLELKLSCGARERQPHTTLRGRVGFTSLRDSDQCFTELLVLLRCLLLCFALLSVRVVQSKLSCFDLFQVKSEKNDTGSCQKTVPTSTFALLALNLLSW